MGSLNRDSSPIEQKRNTIRQLGKAFTESADRVETRTKVVGSGVLGPQLDVDRTQRTAQKIYECVKVTRSTDDTTVALVCNSGLADL
jgi:hypothetical protein